MSKREQRFYAIYSAISLGWIAFFAQWWFDPDHLPATLHGFFGQMTDTLLFLLVTYVVWYPISMQVFYWALAYQIKDPVNAPPEAGKRVAFITTFVPASESIELLHECLPAMVAADYPHDTWLLDEGDVEEVREICSSLGVKHYSRHGIQDYNTGKGKFLRKTKGGNHNSWYDRFGDDYDFVAQLDTDFVPKQNFLTRTLGYFRDPKVAFAGTPQIYGNTGESLVAKGAAEQVYNFYGPILRGFSGMDTTLMIGANHIVRVSALKSVDHYSAHITEDLLTGMKIHAAGWKSVYVPEPLAIGEGPATWPAYFNQQMRWAYGCMDILLRHSPLLLREMSVRRAWYYLFLQQHYFSGLAMILALTGLGVYAAFGVAAANINFAQFAAYYIPVIVVCELMGLWLQRFNIRPDRERGLLLAGRVVSLAAWPIFFMAFVGVITGKRLIYKVTPKGVTSEQITVSSSRTFAVHFAIAAYCIICIAVAVISRHDSRPMLFWLSLSACIMLAVPFAVPAHAFLSKALSTIRRSAK